ncbi:MAG TPA: pitrilysin family protein, partial [Bacteroidia bacterium]|nr:pitrilysin family protein [Bacteroidia bacterium]
MLTETAYQTHTFKNGIKLIFQFNDSFVGHSAILVNAGTRDENTDKEGLAHFIEHVLFKGTKKRKSIHILNRLEVVGGELNAYTTKEETCIHASYLTPYFERAMELMIDIVFNAVFPPKEIIKEQEVVIDEIRTYLDTPAEQIFDDFESQVFAKHPLGSHVLGTIESVSAFTQKDISHFTKQNYTTDKMVISVVGNYQFETVVATIEKHLHTIKATTTTVKRNAFTKYKPTQVIVKKATEQAHFILGGKAYSFKDKQRIELVLLNNILGGPGMNSRLNLSIREKYGYTYNIESNYNAYSDTGIFSLYLATDKKL